MTTLYEGAFAKLNLTLDVLGKRDDGYHDLKSVMQTVSVRDDIEIDIGTGKPWVLKCDKEGIPTDERNLAWKAAKLYLDTVNKDPDGLEIRITKRIPSQAGMGGGSADAAAVLRALNEHYGNPLSILALAELGAQVGSDVPFCVVCGTAMAEGRGERLRGVLHAFSEGAEVYRRLKASGDWLFGIGGVVTYKKSIVAEAVKEMALEDIVLETDCPYLTPVPYRGHRNESAYVRYICEKIAQLKGVEAAQVARITSENARRMFGLK